MESWNDIVKSKVSLFDQYLRPTQARDVLIVAGLVEVIGKESNSDVTNVETHLMQI